MIAELIIHLNGWDAVWYANPGKLSRWLLSSGRWHVGFWTGPHNDLVCVARTASRTAAEKWLSPGGRTILSAALKAMWLRMKGGHETCWRCHHRIDLEPEP